MDNIQSPTHDKRSRMKIEDMRRINNIIRIIIEKLSQTEDLKDYINNDIELKDLNFILRSEDIEIIVKQKVVYEMSAETVNNLNQYIISNNVDVLTHEIKENEDDLILAKTKQFSANSSITEQEKCNFIDFTEKCKAKDNKNDTRYLPDIKSMWEKFNESTKNFIVDNMDTSIMVELLSNKDMQLNTKNDMASSMRSFDRILEIYRSLKDGDSLRRTLVGRMELEDILLLFTDEDKKRLGVILANSKGSKEEKQNYNELCSLDNKECVFNMTRYEILKLIDRRKNDITRLYGDELGEKVSILKTKVENLRNIDRDKYVEQLEKALEKVNLNINAPIDKYEIA